MTAGDDTKREQSLDDAFHEDHRHLTQGLSAILEAVKKDDLPSAVRAADDVDQQAGPHIEFEEEVFYPEVAKSRGHAFVARLHREHDSGRDALERLRRLQGRERLEPEEKALIVADLHQALEHALSCGTLLSHVTTLDSDRQHEILQRLLQYRREGRRWTERPPYEDSRGG